MTYQDSIKIRDIADELVQEANKRFSPVFVIDNDGYNGLMVCCDIIDSMIKRYGITSYEFEIDEDNMDIIINLEMGEIIIQSHGDDADVDVYRIIKAAKSFVVSKINDNAINMRLAFPGIWNKVL